MLIYHIYIYIHTNRISCRVLLSRKLKAIRNLVVIIYIWRTENQVALYEDVTRIQFIRIKSISQVGSLFFSFLLLYRCLSRHHPKNLIKTQQHIDIYIHLNCTYMHRNQKTRHQTRLFEATVEHSLVFFMVLFLDSRFTITTHRKIIASCKSRCLCTYIYIIQSCAMQEMRGGERARAVLCVFDVLLYIYIFFFLLDHIYTHCTQQQRYGE